MQAAYSWSPALARGTSRLVKDAGFDAIHVEHLRGARYGLSVQPVLKKTGRSRPALVWDSVDCISTLFRQAASEARTRRSRLTARIELPRTERFEGWLTTQFDRVLVTSEKDRRDLLRLAGRRTGEGGAAAAAGRVAVLPNGVDLDYFSPSGEPRDPRAIVITGKMSYHANVAAVTRFVEEVMPEVWNAIPEARLWIVGQNPPNEVRRLAAQWTNGHAPLAGGSGSSEPRVLVTGTVEDIRPYLRRAALAVAPVRYAAGIQNKVLEGLACATPVVATPEAVAALAVNPGEDLVVAPEPRAMAAAVVSLLRNPERRAELGRAGRLFVERRHDWRAVARDLAQIYRYARN